MCMHFIYIPCDDIPSSSPMWIDYLIATHDNILKPDELVGSFFRIRFLFVDFSDPFPFLSP